MFSDQQRVKKQSGYLHVACARAGGESSDWFRDQRGGIDSDPRTPSSSYVGTALGGSGRSAEVALAAHDMLDTDHLEHELATATHVSFDLGDTQDPPSPSSSFARRGQPGVVNDAHAAMLQSDGWFGSQSPSEAADESQSPLLEAQKTRLVDDRRSEHISSDKDGIASKGSIDSSLLDRPDENGSTPQTRTEVVTPKITPEFDMSVAQPSAPESGSSAGLQHLGFIQSKRHLVQMGYDIGAVNKCTSRNDLLLLALSPTDASGASVEEQSTEGEHDQGAYAQHNFSAVPGDPCSLYFDSSCGFC